MRAPWPPPCARGPPTRAAPPPPVRSPRAAPARSHRDRCRSDPAPPRRRIHCRRHHRQARGTTRGTAFAATRSPAPPACRAPATNAIQNETPPRRARTAPARRRSRGEEARSTPQYLAAPPRSPRPFHLEAVNAANAAKAARNFQGGQTAGQGGPAQTRTRPADEAPRNKTGTAPSTRQDRRAVISCRVDPSQAYTGFGRQSLTGLIVFFLPFVPPARRARRGCSRRRLRNRLVRWS